MQCSHSYTGPKTYLKNDNENMVVIHILKPSYKHEKLRLSMQLTLASI